MMQRIFCIIMFVCLGLSVSKAADSLQADNVVYIDDATAKAGDELTLSVKLKNANPVYGYEFKLLLPEGVTVVTETDAFGDMEIQAMQTDIRTNASRHTFRTSLKDGVLTVLCYSASKKAFAAGDGEVAQIRVKIPEGMAAGMYPVKIVQEAVSLESSTPVIDMLQSTLTISNAISGDVNGDAKVDILDLVALISYLKGSVPPHFDESAADVDNSGTCNVADVTALANVLLK